MRVGVERLIEAIGSRREHGELRPDVGHLRIVAQDLLQQRDRLRPFALAGEVDGGAVGLEHRALVLRIRQRFARASRILGLRADIAERLQPLARVGRDAARRVNRRVRRRRLSSAPRSAARACARSPAMFVALVRIALQVVQLLAAAP